MSQSAPRAVILAAGFGSRLRPLTDNHPKCLTDLFGRSLLARQREVLAGAGVDEATIVAGHMAEMLRLPGLDHVVNADYARTNMVSSLFAARHLLDGKRDLLIVYGDIVFEARVLASLMAARHEISVVVDRGWHALWSLRMEDPLADAETLRIGPDGRLAELGGKPSSLADIEGQYIGLIKLTASVQPKICAFYDGLDTLGPYLGKDKANMFMTTFVQLLIEAQFDVGPAFTSNGWLEVDSLADLEAYEAAYREGRLRSIYDA
ncbi:phosphocholine cytidylyltransferase family protein [uncultured Bosea sp.]|uniref:phosphocholine cytidylyltransferase family protein n=1 Tax=uncultured Bosea sp. TaxID=211457 RepID=UPI0025CBB603|nr:phosphocholine cytidylyltransferase family protein [uncultured Bosea sp.]